MKNKYIISSKTVISWCVYKTFDESLDFNPIKETTTYEEARTQKVA